MENDRHTMSAELTIPQSFVIEIVELHEHVRLLEIENAQLKLDNADLHKLLAESKMWLAQVNKKLDYAKR
jgi:regulator of replication initiation timing